MPEPSLSAQIIVGAVVLVTGALVGLNVAILVSGIYLGLRRAAQLRNASKPVEEQDHG